MSDARFPATLAPLSDAGWQRFAELMQQSIGLSLTAASGPRAKARLAPRLRRLGLPGFDAYVELLDENGPEMAAALDLLTLPETGFFHEPAQFELLESEFSGPRPARLRLWSAATACGEEAYSLAMLLADLQAAGRVGADWTVLGTDISARRLRSAQGALYAEAPLRRQVAAGRLQRHALGASAASTAILQMRASLRERVRFQQHDLREPFDTDERFDAVLLRQLLLYVDRATRRTVLAHVLEHLKPGGLLLVGVAEQGLVDAAEVTPLGSGAFRKQAA